MSGCLWCGHDVYWTGSFADDSGACFRCGARHEFDGELVGENWRGSSTLLSRGKPELRANTDEADEAEELLDRDLERRTVEILRQYTGRGARPDIGERAASLIQEWEAREAARRAKEARQ